MLSLEWHRIQFQVNFKLASVWIEVMSYFKILIYHHPGRTTNTTKYFWTADLCSDTKMWKPEHTVTMVIATVIIHSTQLSQCSDYGLDSPGSNPGLTTHPLLVPRSWKSRAIPLPTLWATPGL